MHEIPAGDLFGPAAAAAVAAKSHAPRDGEVTVGIGVGEAAATAAPAAPAPDVVAVVPGAAASAITVYPTQQWRRNFRDHIIPVRLRGEKVARRGVGWGRTLRRPLTPLCPASRL